MNNPTQDSLSALDTIIDRHLNEIKAGHDGKLKKAIEAYVTTRVKEAERLARIDERQEARNIAHLHRRNECRELDVLFEQRLEALTTTTNGKGE